MAYVEIATYVRSVGYAAVSAWAASTAYSVGQIVRQLTTPTVGNERCYVCIVAGTSLTTEPAWAAGSTARGNIVIETGGPHWQECTGLPALNGDNASTNKWHGNASSIALGWIIQNVAGDHYFISTVAGATSVTTEPTWNTTAGATTVEGSVTWTCLGPVSSFTATWAAPHAKLYSLFLGSNYWLLNAGMTAWIGDDHAETNTGQNINPANSCSIICIDHTAALPPTSASLKTTAAINFTTAGGAFFASFISGLGCYVYGLVFNGAAHAEIANNGQSRSRFERCTFNVTAAVYMGFGDNANTGAVLELKDCTFAITNVSTNGVCLLFRSSVIKIENGVFSVGSVSGTGPNNPVLCSGSSNATTIEFEGCDFTGIPNTLYLTGNNAGGGPPSGTWMFKDCALSAGMPIYIYGTNHYPALDNETVDLCRVDGGGAVYRNERYNMAGVETTATALVRTNGASDGTTPISHQIAATPNANNTSRPFNAIPIVTWNGTVGANRNVTLCGIVNDARVPNNGELWFDVEYLGTSASTKGGFARGGKSNVLAAATPLAADSSAWDSNVPARQSNTAYSVGQAIKLASNPGQVFWCTGAGTTAASLAVLTTVTPTWNPSDLSSMSLSSGNLIATATVATSAVVRGNAAQTSPGKFYFEVLLGGTTLGNPTMVGVATAGVALSSLLTGVGGVGLSLTGFWYLNGISQGASGIAAAVAGDTICVAVDLSVLRIWFRKNAVGWSGNGSPDADVGGYDISSLFSGVAALPFFVANGAINNTGSANFTGSPTGFAYSVPVGFAGLSGTSGGGGSGSGGYTGVADGGSVLDGTATFRAGCRFSQTLTLSSPQPQEPGYIYGYPKVGRPNFTYNLDPLLQLS